MYISVSEVKNFGNIVTNLYKANHIKALACYRNIFSSVTKLTQWQKEQPT